MLGGRITREPVSWLAWAASDVGRRRERNEDSFCTDAEIGLFLVADGMGGHAGGQTASRLAVSILRREVTAAAPTLADAPATEAARLSVAVLERAIEVACREVHERARLDRELDGMGTTITALLLGPHGGALAHVGDSRAYLVRDGALLQLSEDHSLVQEQLRLGLINDAQARSSRLRNVITRSVGVEPEVTPDLLPLAPRPGDRFLLCSDGLSNYVEPSEVVMVLESHLLAKAPEIFVDLANERGGADNVTAVVVYVRDAD
ncbi:MAG: serine/threonine-protein phosphatase [Deltaproteobacteria bacterium]|nr:serine/threonine-protein phosphatase [Deltaproteobacteria bacterium]